jgi:hypothetical protein
MADPKKSPKRLAGILDYIAKLREELLTIQTSLEKLESGESATSEHSKLPTPPPPVQRWTLGLG